MSQAIEKEVIQMLSKMTGFEPAEITPDKHMVRDLGVDSLKVIEIATAIEQKFKITVKESHMAKIRTVSDSIRLIKELVKKRIK